MRSVASANQDSFVRERTNYWMRHEGKDMAALYAGQLTGVDLEDVKWRQEWAEKASLGFTLPELVGQTGRSPLERVAA